MRFSEGSVEFPPALDNEDGRPGGRRLSFYGWGRLP